MKCVRCNRQLDKAAGFDAGLPVGPVCFKKMFGSEMKPVKSVAVAGENQMDLFKVAEITIHRLDVK
jgi:hypothetical protein